MAQRGALNIAVSQAVAWELPVRSEVIHNPYRDDLFFVESPAKARDKDLVFLGNLGRGKGVDLLIRALGVLAQRGHRPNLTVIGDGAALPNLKALVACLGLGERVEFVGAKTGRDLADLLRRARVQVIPSRWPEAFGVVALEGIACGCVVVAAENGGLPEAVGPCGVLYKSGDPASLANAVEPLLRDPSLLAGFRQRTRSHLDRHRPGEVAER